MKIYTNCKYCNYCKYYHPLYLSRLIPSCTPTGFCTKVMAGYDSTGRYLSRKRAYYDSCDEFVFSIHNWYNIVDPSEITEFPELRKKADLFREEVKYSYPEGWMV